MNEMVERVAITVAGPARWAAFDDEHKNAAREIARASIAAMRDPTHEMLLAADVADERSREMFPAGEDSDAIPAPAGAHWQAMIDEALK